MAKTPKSGWANRELRRVAREAPSWPTWMEKATTPQTSPSKQESTPQAARSPRTAS